MTQVLRNMQTPLLASVTPDHTRVHASASQLSISIVTQVAGVDVGWTPRPKRVASTLSRVAHSTHGAPRVSQVSHQHPPPPSPTVRLPVTCALKLPRDQAARRTTKRHGTAGHHFHREPAAFYLAVADPHPPANHPTPGKNKNRLTLRVTELEEEKKALSDESSRLVREGRGGGGEGNVGGEDAPAGGGLAEDPAAPFVVPGDRRDKPGCSTVTVTIPIRARVVCLGFGVRREKRDPENACPREWIQRKRA